MSIYDEAVGAPTNDKPVDEYSAAVAADSQNTRQQALANLVGAMGSNPDMVAQTIKVAKQTGVPQPAVEQDPDTYMQLAKLGVDRATLEASPKLEAFLAAHPINAKLASDSLHQAAAIEGLLRSPDLTNWTPSVGERLTEWTRNQFGMDHKDLARAMNQYAAKQSGLSMGQARDAVGGLGEGPEQFAANMVHVGSLGLIPNVAGDAQTGVGGAVGGAGALAGFLLGAPLKLGAAAVAPVTGGMLSHVAGESFVKALTKDVGGQALTLGTAGALGGLGDAINSPDVATAFKKEARDFGTNAATGAIFGTAGRVLPDSTIAQTVARWVGISAATDAAGGKTPFSDIANFDTLTPAEKGQAIFNYGLNAFFSAHGAGRVDGGWLSDVAKAKDAPADIQRISELSQAAASSKWRERDTTGFRQFVSDATEGGTLADTYIDAGSFKQGMATAGLNDAELAKTLPDVAAQLHEAAQTNGMLKIKTADYLTFIAGTELDKAILSDLRTDPAAMTNNELAAFRQGEVERMTATATDATSADPAINPDQGKKAVFDDVLSQVNATGRFTPDVAKAYAALHSEFFATLADRTGTTPQGAYATYGAKVAAYGKGAFTQGERGSYNPADRTIALLESADLTTFLHETGHHFLDTYAKVAHGNYAPAAVKADMTHLLKWMGVESLGKWHSMTVDEQRAAHEKFANGFEDYLMTGKSPSLEMQPIFSRFRTWLVHVYKSLRGAALSPEVRGVMDRMVASEQSIKLAEQARGYAMPFKSEAEAAAAGIQPDAYRELQAAHNEATRQAVEDMQTRSVRDLKWGDNARGRVLKRLQREAKDARAAVKPEAEKEVAKEPIEQARRWLTTGEMTHGDEQIKAEKGFKLNTDDLKTMFPETSLARPDLSRLRGLTAKDGLHPDMVAEMFGLRSGEQLVRELADSESTKSKIDGVTDRLMLERHGELSNPEAIAHAASMAISNESRARAMATGLKVLAKSPTPARILEKGAKEAADAAIAAKKVEDVNPRQYEAQEARSSRDVLKLAPRDTVGAVKAQRAALLNNRLVSSAREALDDVRQGVIDAKRLAKPSVRDNIDVAFRAQIDTLLSQYDFRTSLTADQAQMQDKVKLESFIEKLAANNYNMDVPQWLYDKTERTHYTQLTVEQFRGLMDTVRTLEKVGRTVQKVTDGNVSRNLADVAAEAKEQLAKLPQRKNETNRGLSLINEKWLKAKSWGRGVDAALLKVEQMCDWLDKGDTVNGVFNRMVFRKAAVAEGVRNDLDAKISKQVAAFVAAFPKEQIKPGERYVMPGVVDGLTGETQTVTHSELLALAAIRGDAQHFDKLCRGEKWDPSAVIDFLNRTMTKDGWGFVKGMSDQFQEVYELKKEMLRKTGTDAPKDVERISFDTPHGTMPGWYWPIKYDPARTFKVADRHSKDVSSVFEDNFYNSNSNTSTGREMTRNENYAKPMLLSMDAFPSILKDEIRDVTTRVPLMEIERFLKHPDVRTAVGGALSPEHYEAMRNWVVSMANDARVDPSELQMWDRAAHELRTRTTMVGLGLRFSTMAMHAMTAGAESVAELGPRAMLNGIRDSRSWTGLMRAIGPEFMQKGADAFLRSRNLNDNSNFIFERSAEMRHRMTEGERDVRESLRDIQTAMMDPATGALRKAQLAIQARAYQGIAMLDMASAMPTWMGAYLKGIEKAERGGLGLSEKDAAYFADKTVRNAHGGGGIKDMAAVQRGSEGFKMFTMFYTFWSHNINRIRHVGHQWADLPDDYAQARAAGQMGKFTGDTGSLLMRTFMYTLGVQMIHALFHPSDEDEKLPHKLARWSALSLVGGIPGARDIGAHVWGGKDYEMSPIAGVMRSFDMTGRDITGDSNGEKWIKHSLTTAGYIMNLPLGQVGATTQFLSDVWDGKQNPQDMADWWHGISSGKAEH